MHILLANPADISRLAASSKGMGLCLVHPWYLKHAHAEAIAAVRYMRGQVQMVMDGRFAVTVSQEASHYLAYQRRRRRFIRRTALPIGILVEAFSEVDRSLRILAAENPAITWLVITTQTADDVDHLACGITWPEAVRAARAFGITRLTVFGCNDGNPECCVPQTARLMAENGISTKIAHRKSFCYAGRIIS